MTEPQPVGGIRTIDASYMAIRPYAEGQHVHRTVDISPSLMVDLDAAGGILGIERIGGPVDIGALGDVLRWVTVP
jgi:hypothetical protein